MRSRKQIWLWVIRALLALLILLCIGILIWMAVDAQHSGTDQQPTQTALIHGIFPDPDQILVKTEKAERTLSAGEDGYDRILYLNEQRLPACLYRIGSMADDALSGGTYVAYLYSEPKAVTVDCMLPFEEGNGGVSHVTYYADRICFYTDENRQGWMVIRQNAKEPGVFVFLGDVSNLRACAQELTGE